ncbi:D-lactate dehydrogenase (cytochrome) [Leptothrix cholodnii SP-6]|uniref:D-lactate dehydrogenase (cytochrome) n=1 Tax=Leptothrix cholodnii (strain ATCC 51168 / LMG 8142 / SP-6) TaxID=395495 RepID=B1Y6Z9_LEPCP|nr:FAD-linked oxidase C-terminal domain-containing protein [Leptothrix cholodnii]ACB32477.1 D-lactate dehydrogenase (cytochrome) [Leptothrix cholodnii SP-6]
MNAPHSHDWQPAIRPRPMPAAMREQLQQRFGSRLSTAQAVRDQHGRDESPYDTAAPEAVLFCESNEDVAAAVAIAHEHAVPVIPFGVGSSLEGHLLAVQGGLSLDLSRMNRILSLNPEDLTVTVQAGVTRMQLNNEIRHSGLFFPIDPGADATLGGMSATRASGTNAVRYGTMRENVLALTVVTASGELVHTGTRARKSSAGYDLTRLFVGSEGTLGVMTEITLKLYPLPEAVLAAICHFPSIAAAVDTTIGLIQMGVPIARCELIDARTVGMVNRHNKLDLREQDMLLMEFHGSPASVREQAETVQALAAENGGESFEWAETPEERTRLWTARHHAYFAAVQSRPGCRAISTDTCVPISRLAECIVDTVADVDACGLPYFLVGHVGDGNFHIGFLIDPDSPDEGRIAEQVNRTLVARALQMAGTCTGEHGIGLHKMGFLLDEAGPGAVALMRQIKHALDPKNIMNPGKIFAW